MAPSPGRMAPDSQKPARGRFVTLKSRHRSEASQTGSAGKRVPVPQERMGRGFRHAQSRQVERTTRFGQVESPRRADCRGLPAAAGLSPLDLCAHTKGALRYDTPTNLDSGVRVVSERARLRQMTDEPADPCPETPLLRHGEDLTAPPGALCSRRMMPTWPSEMLAA
jgi:hypothetical protein